MQNNLDWYYNTLTQNSVTYEKTLFDEAGIDPNKNLELFEDGDRLFHQMMTQCQM